MGRKNTTGGYMDWDRPILIGGCPSSGTTLLSCMLDAHPDLMCGPELSFFCHPYLWSMSGPAWRQRLLAALNAPRLGLGEEYWDLQEGVVPYVPQVDTRSLGWYDLSLESIREMAGRSRDAVELSRRFFLAALEKYRKSRWAEKSPPNLYAAPHFLHRCPQGRCLLLVRDGRDIVCSLLRRGFSLGSACAIWTMETALTLQLAESERIRTIRYEDLVKEPKATLRGIATFLELSGGLERMLAYHDNTGRVKHDPTIRVGAWKSTPDQPINVQSVGQWKRDLSKEQTDIFYAYRLIERAEIPAGFRRMPAYTTLDLLKAFGYEAPGKRSISWRSLSDFVYREKHVVAHAAGRGGFHRRNTVMDFRNARAIKIGPAELMKELAGAARRSKEASGAEARVDELDQLRHTQWTLSAQLQATEAARAKAEAAYSDALASANAVESARAKAEESYAESGRQYRILQSEKERVEGALEAKEAERSKAEAAYWDALASAKAAESARAKAEEGCAGLSRQCQALQSEKERVEGALEANEAERTKAEAAYWDALASANAVESARAKAEAAYSDVLASANAVESARAKAEEGYAELNRQYQILQSEKERVEGALEAKEAERAKAEAAYSDALASANAVESARAKAEEGYAELGRQYQILQSEKERVERLLEAKEAESAKVEASLREFLTKAREQRDTAENAYVRLNMRYSESEAQRERLAAECQSMRGIWGGTREILYVFKKRILGLWESLYQIKKRVVGWQPAVPQEWFPPDWKTLEGPPPVTSGRPCVLVLSHMFPHPDQPHLGSFILEQVRALRRHTNMDVRVLSGRPFWMNRSRNPLTLWRLNRVYFRFLETVCWRELCGVPVMYVPFRVFARPWIHGTSYRQAMRHVIARVREGFPFVLVHAHTAYLDGTAGLAISQQCRVPLLITEHTGPFSNLLRGRVMTGQTTRALNGAERTIAVSSSLKRCMGQVMTPEKNAKTIVLPNGVDLDLFNPPAEHRPDPRVPRIFFVGGFAGVKNLPLLLRAFALLARDIPGATLSLVGDGDRPADREALEALAAQLGLGNKAQFLGSKKREEVAQLLREEADLLVLSSATETFGCVLVESLACGKPVVATRCGGPEDIITSDAVGRLCENGSVEDLARALREVIAELPRFSKDTIRAYAVERFGFESVSRRIAAIYQDLPAPGDDPPLSRDSQKSM